MQTLFWGRNLLVPHAALIEDRIRNRSLSHAGHRSRFGGERQNPTHYAKSILFDLSGYGGSVATASVSFLYGSTIKSFFSGESAKRSYAVFGSGRSSLLRVQHSFVQRVVRIAFKNTVNCPKGISVAPRYPWYKHDLTRMVTSASV